MNMLEQMFLGHLDGIIIDVKVLNAIFTEIALMTHQNHLTATGVMMHMTIIIQGMMTTTLLLKIWTMLGCGMRDTVQPIPLYLVIKLFHFTSIGTLELKIICIQLMKEMVLWRMGNMCAKTQPTMFLSESESRKSLPYRVVKNKQQCSVLECISFLGCYSLMLMICI